jgi:hypothetical protein
MLYDGWHGSLRAICILRVLRVFAVKNPICREGAKNAKKYKKMSYVSVKSV